jgi:hypothetical protein
MTALEAEQDDRPKRRDDDDPIPLGMAAADYGISKGVLKANGLRGDLAIYKLGTKYYTTPRAIRQWVESCRVDQKGRDFTLTRSASNGLSGTERVSSALAAANETVLRLRHSSRNTSATSISRKSRARR